MNSEVYYNLNQWSSIDQFKTTLYYKKVLQMDKSVNIPNVSWRVGILVFSEIPVSVDKKPDLHLKILFNKNRNGDLEITVPVNKNRDQALNIWFWFRFLKTAIRS